MPDKPGQAFRGKQRQGNKKPPRQPNGQTGSRKSSKAERSSKGLLALGLALATAWCVPFPTRDFAEISTT